MKNLVKAKEPIISKVLVDDLTRELIEPFDYSSNGEERFYPYEIPTEMPKDFNLGLIVGASGKGKSTLLQKFNNQEEIYWTDNSIASHFDNSQDAYKKLTAVGLSSVPDWVKPYKSLSTGQKFRAEMARRLKNNAVIDEFTSVVDRNVAKSVSVSISRYIKKTNLKNIVFASCHKDIIDFLQPDWIIDLDEEKFYTERYLRQSKLLLKIYPASHTIWEYFFKHHYLSEKLNKASHSYIAFWEDQLVGFCSIMSYPSGTVKNAFRVHRLVVLPDFQGLGIGVALLESVANHYFENNKRFFIKTSHPKLGNYLDNSKNWKPTSKNHKKRTEKTGKNARWSLNPNRWSYSHEFVGLSNNE